MEAKWARIQVGVQRLPRHRALVNAQQPLFQQGGNPVHAGQQGRGGLSASWCRGCRSAGVGRNRTGSRESNRCRGRSYPMLELQGIGRNQVEVQSCWQNQRMVASGWAEKAIAQSYTTSYKRETVIMSATLSETKKPRGLRLANLRMEPTRPSSLRSWRLGAVHSDRSAAKGMREPRS